MTPRTFLTLLLLALLSLPALARPRTGRICRGQDFVRPDRWLDDVKVDPRAEYVVPLNIVRIYSDEHAAERIAPKRWLNAQLQIANWLYSLPEAEMATYTGSRKAPCLQFRLNKIYDVHERDVSQALGYDFDTEKVAGGGRQTHNGPRISSTEDLRELKVTEGTDMLTVFCVWALKNPSHLTQEIGGESNVGFAEPMPTGPRSVLSRVTSIRARMGVVTARQETTWMNTLAHEFGHYFGLFHAWDRQRNHGNGIADLGIGPMGSVDSDKLWANVMDYDNGPNVNLYFARSQLDFMYRFARDKASTQVRITRQTGPTTTTPVVRAAPNAKFKRLTIQASRPGGPVVVKGGFEVNNAKKQDGQLIVWFNDRSGQKLKDTDQSYNTVDGQVCAFAKFSPDFDATTFSDFTVTLPAGQLHLPPGRYALKANAGIVVGGKVIATSSFTAFTYTVPGRTAVPSVRRAAAWITKTTARGGVIHKGVRWVEVKADVVLDNLVAREVLAEARFFLRDGRQLKDFDKQYVDARGMAYANAKITPKLARTQTTITLWIPEPQLHLVAGAWQVYANVSLTQGITNLASTSTAGFTVGVPKVSAKPRTLLVPTADVQKIWTTHNATVSGQAGMYVHCTADVDGMNGKDVKFVAWFWMQNGEKLKDFNGHYKTADGQVSCAVTVRPRYDNTRFSDVSIFIPYSELHLVRGKHNLGVTVGAFTPENGKLGGRNDMARFEVNQG